MCRISLMASHSIFSAKLLKQTVTCKFRNQKSCFYCNCIAKIHEKAKKVSPLLAVNE